VAERARMEDGEIVFDNKDEGLARALRDGVFVIKFPNDEDVKQTDKFAETWFLDKDGGEDDDMKGYRSVEVHDFEVHGYFCRKLDDSECLKFPKKEWHKVYPAAVASAVEQMNSMNNAIAKMALRANDIDERQWDTLTSGVVTNQGNHLCTFHHYRRDNKLAKRGLTFHKDVAFASVLRNAYPGLVIQTNEGEIQAFDPVDGYYIGIFGRLMELLTAKLKRPVCGTPHAVVSTHQGGYERLSYLLAGTPNIHGNVYLCEPDGTKQLYQRYEEFGSDRMKYIFQR